MHGIAALLLFRVRCCLLLNFLASSAPLRTVLHIRQHTNIYAYSKQFKFRVVFFFFVVAGSVHVDSFCSMIALLS